MTPNDLGNRARGRHNVTIKHQIKAGHPFKKCSRESLAATPSGESFMTSYRLPVKVKVNGNGAR